PERIFTSQDLVHFHRPVCLILLKGTPVLGVRVGHTGEGRLRQSSLGKQQHSRINQLGWDLIIREGIADELAGIVRVFSCRKGVFSSKKVLRASRTSLRKNSQALP